MYRKRLRVDTSWDGVWYSGQDQCWSSMDVHPFPWTQNSRGHRVEKEFDGLQNLMQALWKGLREPEGRSGCTEPGEMLSSCVLLSSYFTGQIRAFSIIYWIRRVDREHKLQSSAFHKWEFLWTSLTSEWVGKIE